MLTASRRSPEGVRSIGWIVRLINDGMHDASMVFDLSSAGVMLDFDSDFTLDGVDEGFAAPRRPQSKEELLRGFAAVGEGK